MKPKKNPNIAAPNLTPKDELALQFKATDKPKKFNVNIIKIIPNLKTTFKKLVIFSEVV